METLITEIIDDNVQNTMKIYEALVQANKQLDWAMYPDKTTEFMVVKHAYNCTLKWRISLKKNYKLTIKLKQIIWKTML